MAEEKFGVDINLSENKVLGLCLERFDNLSLPASAVEGRLGYHLIKKMPTFHNGLAFEYLVTEGYVNAMLGGLAWKDEVEAASGTNVDISTLINGVTIDGVTLSTSQRVLLFGQTDLSENGVWVVGVTQERPFDLNESGDFNNAVVPVKGGNTYQGWQFRCTTVDPVVDVDDIEFVDMTPIIPDASTVVAGKLRLSTPEEVALGENGTSSVSPLTLKGELDPIRTMLNAIIHAAPQNLSGLDLTMTLYTALQAGTGTSHQCTDDLTPDGSVADFYNGDTGVLTAEIDTVDSGNRTLTTGSDVGVYGALNITDDSDPYPVGQMGHGLYKQLSAFIRAESNLALGSHTYRLTHSITGNTNLLTFWVDNPTTVTISGVSVTLPTLTRYISGVPSLATGDVIGFDFSVNSAVKKHYHSTRLARLESSFAGNLDIAPPVSPPAEDAVVGYTGKQLTVQASKYSENLPITIYGYNSKGVAGTAAPVNTGSRVDTVSSETRKTAGSGLYPASGYNGVFSSSQSLKTFYTEELQLLNGKYQFPAGNYSGNLPTAGPDYSSGMGAGTRWVLFNPGVTLSNNSSLVVTLPSTEGTWTGVETTGLYVQVKVVGVTGWLNANAAFSLIGAPVNDGDACMLFSDSTATVKKVSFGNTPRSGVLLIRIGLPAGSNKKFGQGVTVTNII